MTLTGELCVWEGPGEGAQFRSQEVMDSFPCLAPGSPEIHAIIGSLRLSNTFKNLPMADFWASYYLWLYSVNISYDLVRETIAEWMRQSLSDT